jgi:hypothetical protein
MCAGVLPPIPQKALVHGIPHDLRKHEYPVLRDQLFLDGRTKKLVRKAVQTDTSLRIVLHTHNEIHDLADCWWAGHGEDGGTSSGGTAVEPLTTPQCFAFPCYPLIARTIVSFAQGGQYVSLAFGRAARDPRIAVSMGSRGDAYDNAVAETFFATLKKELVNRRSWPSRLELQSAVFEYIEAFYNRQRRHSTLGMLSPAGYEQLSLLGG